MAKKTDSTIARVYDAAQRAWVFNVKDPVNADGFKGSLTLYINKMSAENRETALIDRMANRIIDAAAIPFEKNKRYATPEEKFTAMKTLVDFYNSGAKEWSIRPAGVTKVDLDRVLLFDALKLQRADMATRDAKDARTDEQIKEFIAGKSAADVTAILVTASVKPWADKVRAEAVADLNGEEMLAGL